MAPFRSVSALMITVVPWARNSTDPRSACAIAFITPFSKRPGVVELFASPTLPLASSRWTRSVNVPPMSTAQRVAKGWF